MNEPSALSSFIPVTLTRELSDQCWDFGQACAPGNLDKYKESNQSDPAKIAEQIYYGKLCEWAVYSVLKECDADPTIPDMQIYAKDAKSFAPDMSFRKADGKRSFLHVKGQSIYSARTNGVSVTIQASVGRRDHKVMNAYYMPRDADQIAMCLMDTEQWICWVYAMMPIVYLHNYILLDEPRQKDKDEHKRAVYYERLHSLFDDPVTRKECLWYSATLVPKLNSLIKSCP